MDCLEGVSTFGLGILISGSHKNEDAMINAVLLGGLLCSKIGVLMK